MDWQTFIQQEREQDYLRNAEQYVAQRRSAGVAVYPQAHEVYRAFEVTPFDQVKAVILGQDPYHGPNQAHGLSFSVKPGIKVPPSLRNIFKELANDINGFEAPEHGDLSGWARQGVLLLNAVLSVEQGAAHSHAAIGWETLTDRALKLLSDQREGIVFLLWGKPAQRKQGLIDEHKHTVLTAPHPSPLSAHRGFLGCKHFSQTNDILLRQGKQPVDWQL